ncbi:MAG: hypothetical protein Kow00124_14770 [Anaerolineae bacterium]
MIILIILILAIAVAAVFFLQGFLGGGQAAEGGVQEPDVIPTPTQPPTVDIIVAARDIPRGARLSAQDVTILRWPVLTEAPPPIDALVVTGDAGLEQVEDRIARVDIITGQPVLDFMLTPGDQPTSLGDIGSDAALMIPSGYVMITIPVTRISAAGFAPRDGDHVDILVSFEFVSVDEDFQTPLPNTGIILTDDGTLAELGLQGFEYAIGRRETGPFGSTLLVVPSQTTSGQIPRRATQLMIDNAIVMRLGNWPLGDLNQPIVITPVPTATPIPEGEEVPEPGATPVATPIQAFQVPDIISLAMSRQDALVLKYALEVGANIDLVLRSALDDDINNVVTDPVTLEYIIQFYNLPVPALLPDQISPEMLGLTAEGAAAPATEETTTTEGQ